MIKQNDVLLSKLLVDEILLLQRSVKTLELSMQKCSAIKKKRSTHLKKWNHSIL